MDEYLVKLNAGGQLHRFGLGGGHVPAPVATVGQSSLFCVSFCPDFLRTTQIRRDFVVLPEMCAVCGVSVPVKHVFRLTKELYRTFFPLRYHERVTLSEHRLPACEQHADHPLTCTVSPSGNGQFFIECYAIHEGFLRTLVEFHTRGEYLPPWAVDLPDSLHLVARRMEDWWFLGFYPFWERCCREEQQAYFRRWEIPDGWREEFEFLPITKKS